MIIYRWSLIIAATVLGLWFIVNVARSHDFYSSQCCSGVDCALAPQGAVDFSPEGWVVHRGLTNPAGVVLQQTVIVPFDDPRIRSIPPDHAPGLHICSNSNRVICIYLDGGT